MAEENLIPITEIEGSFKNFLAEDNSRIFFSGKYGIGKTHFLNEFFRAHSDEFETFHLYPVNYQISSNEDIIDLLKYDVLIKFLEKNSEVFDSNDIAGVSGWTSLFVSFLKEKGSWNGFLQATVGEGGGLLDLSPDPIMKAVGKLGKSVQELLKFDNEFQKFKKEYKEGDKGKVEKFLSEMETKTISDTDYLSYILREKISKQKGDKRSVLILDDMDRIDPEHIFRILNVFSAHFNDEGNKFGFDHVIIVGDVNNIKSIFHHKYGAGAEFTGYFDKFFTLKPYILDNKKVIIERIPNLVKQIKCEEQNLEKAIGESGYIKLLLSEILERAVSVDRLNLRQLYKPLNHGFVELGKGVYSEDYFSNNRQKILDIGIKLLIAIFGGDKDFFISVLRDIKKSLKVGGSPNHLYKIYVGLMITSIVKATPGVQTAWHTNHYFTLPLDPKSDSIKIEGDAQEHAVFFYDALIEYVTQSNYVKNGYSDYDN